MRPNVLVLGVVAAVLCSRLDAQVFRDDLRPADAKNWDVVAGDWAAGEAGWAQQKNDGGYCYALAKTDFRPSSIEFEATPLERNKYDFCSIGVVLKYADAKNYMILRLGSYRSISLMYWTDGQRTISNLGNLVLTPGERHTVKIMVADGRIGVLMDGKLRFILRDPMPDVPLRFGLYTECRCRFEGVAIKGGADQ